MLVFYVSRYFNPKAVGVPMLICNTLCYVFCLGSAATGIFLEFTYTPAVMFAKLATLFLYYQVFEVSRYRRIIAGIGVIIILQCLVAITLACSICRPFRYFWTQAADVKDGTCGDVMLFIRAIAFRVWSQM
ncbi:hypothetical protein N7540_011157 [Penicillium herquei]|nr:hypothetical protein N7540_011157 [Penicillium herquei]